MSSIRRSRSVVAAGLGDVDRAVPDDDRDRPVVVAGGDGVDHVAGAVARDPDGEPVGAQLLEHPQRPPPRLAQVADAQQPEAAVEQRRWPPELLEVVGDRPVGEGVEPVHRADHAAGEIGGAPDRVVGPVEVRRMGAPLGPPQRDAGPAVAGGDRSQVERRVAVGVGGEEVDRRARLAGGDQHLVDPGRRRRRRTADGERSIDAFHGGRADVVQPEVLVTGAGPEHVEVRLVPDLEAPAADLLAPVALDQMRGELAHQLAPTIPVPRRRHDGPVVEHGLVRVPGEIAGHVADLDDRSQPE